MYLATRRLRKLEPELEQFAMDARCAPKWIGQTHLPDQPAQLRGDTRLTAPGARLPTPVEAEAETVPSHHRFGLNDRDGIARRWKDPRQPDEYQPIDRRQSRPRGRTPTQYIQLMPQNDDLSFQSRLRLEGRDQNVEQQLQDVDHRASHYSIRALRPARMRFSAGTAGRTRSARPTDAPTGSSKTPEAVTPGHAPAITLP
jgi:hypothetical protein